MKKNILLFVLMIYLVTLGFSETKLKTFVSGAYDVYLHNEGFLFTSPIEDEIFIDKKNIYIDEYKWKKMIKSGLPFGEYDKIKREYINYDAPFIIDGSNYAIFLSSFCEGFNNNLFFTQFFETLDAIETLKTDEILEYKSSTFKKTEWGNVIAYHNIVSITASSYYIENGTKNIIEYVPQVISALFSVGLHNLWIRHNPWVPGKEKSSSGIGEYLEIEFTKPKDNLVVLNGYVDPYKHYLYKANNRVKKAIITSLDKDNPFEIEYDFEDYVHFSEINFPKAVNKVRFTIKEVYKGEKWDDTCITAVITRWEE